MFGRLLWAALLTGALVCPAWAENDKSRARAHGVEPAFAVTAAPRPLVTSRDRLIAYAYFRQEYLAGNCPAGLVKRPIGCQMPGEPKRQWTLGQRLSPITPFFLLPVLLLDRLPRPPGDVVGDADRLTLVSYFRDDYARGSCPADLAHTERGCETRPLWAIGEPLDPLAISEPLPDRLVVQLEPLPNGYRYVRVADHVLVMVVATRLIRADVLDLADLAGFSPYQRRRP